MTHSLHLAFCSVVAALGTAIMVLTGLIPGGTYAFPAFAGVLLISVVAEAGKRWAISTFAVQSILSVLLAADKEAVLFFILFFGYYPILKAVLESRLQKKWLVVIVKLLVFNITAVMEFWVSVTLLGIPAESFTFFGYDIPWLLLLIYNLVFLIYDYAVSLLVIEYFNRLHPILKKKFHLK